MHPSIQPLLKYFEYDHLPPHLQEISGPFKELAHGLVHRLGENEDGSERDLGGGAQLNHGLHKLLESKDAMVRSALTLEKNDG